MSGLKNLETRLKYQGGITQESRFQQDKLNSLRKALLYSYQAETAVLEDGRMFRCLINSDRLKADYDTKILSIPYEDICLGYEDKRQEPDGKTSERIQKIGLKPGDVFKWKETDTYWLIYLEHLEEDSYFRADIYKCEEVVTIYDREYHIYIRGPVETTIPWNQKSKKSWNDMNYSLIIRITKNEDTLDYFHRFKTITIGGNEWMVAAVDPYSADGIIEIALDEWFNNEFAEAPSKAPIEPPQIDIDPALPRIEGPTELNGFDKAEYKIIGLQGGKWVVDNTKKAALSAPDKDVTKLQLMTGKTTTVTLTYVTATDKIDLKINVKTL